jgi:hypothetical protein
MGICLILREKSPGRERKLQALYCSNFITILDFEFIKDLLEYRGWIPGRWACDLSKAKLNAKLRRNTLIQALSPYPHLHVSGACFTPKQIDTVCMSNRCVILRVYCLFDSFPVKVTSDPEARKIQKLVVTFYAHG